MNKALKMVLALTAMLAAGCSEGTVAPSSQTPETTLVGGGSNAALTGNDTVRFTFDIDPARAKMFSLGQGNTINFPAHSLCDTKSSYGTTEWDEPCTAATKPVTITAKAWLDKGGHPRLDFKPDVRFVPSTNPATWVILTFGDQAASQDAFYSILYCANSNSAYKKCIDESKTDRSVATLRDPLTGRVYRRVKHFSGYTVGADGCDPTDPSCGGGDGVFNRSGLNHSGNEH